MVQLFYWESRGKSGHKLLQAEGYPNRVLLFPYEGWARPTCQTFWTIKPTWWNKKRCKIVEISGSNKMTGKGKMVDSGKGTLVIVGKFKHVTDSPNFKLHLTTNVSNADFQLGYSMTGILERGPTKKEGAMEFTHYAMIKRKGY